MKEMVTIIPLGACPKCGHRQFVVSEMQINEYLTNPDGEIIDSLDVEYDAEGYCINCNSTFKMYPTREGFIPLTRLREIMLGYTPHMQCIRTIELDDLANPMEVTTYAR